MSSLANLRGYLRFLNKKQECLWLRFNALEQEWQQAQRQYEQKKTTLEALRLQVTDFEQSGTLFCVQVFENRRKQAVVLAKVHQLQAELQLDEEKILQLHEQKRQAKIIWLDIQKRLNNFSRFFNRENAKHDRLQMQWDEDDVQEVAIYGSYNGNKQSDPNQRRRVVCNK